MLKQAANGGIQSDVAAGLLVGVFWLLVGFAVAEFDRRPAA
jgi:hypothetical protein